MARSSWMRRFGFAVTSGAIVIPAAIACNALVGLDDFERAECAGRKCVGEGGVSDVQTIDVKQPDAAVEAGPGEPPTSWPKWPMPNYDAGGIPNAPLWQELDKDTARDTTTKLTWRRAPSTKGPNERWLDAVRTCDELAPAGSWRLPTRIELVTLLDYSHASPFRMTVINGLLGGTVWTSSALKPFTGDDSQAYWVVNFDTGAVETKAGSTGAIALCTRNL